MAYEVFAGVYDAFNEDADYDALCTQILARLRAHGIDSGIIADLGCGTGDLTLRLAAAGYDMIGVDLSEEMLCVLREKMAEAGRCDILLLQQDLRRLDLYGTINAAVSTFDTFNHIGPYEQFRAALTRSALFIEPGGLFLFDMNTPYKHERVLADQRYVMEDEEILFTWQNHYDAARRATDIHLDITYKDEDEPYEEDFTEYAYTLEEIRAACEEAGLAVEDVCDGEAFGPLTQDSQRYLVTARKLAGRNCNRVYEEEEKHGKDDPGDL